MKNNTAGMWKTSSKVNFLYSDQPWETWAPTKENGTKTELLDVGCPFPKAEKPAGKRHRREGIFPERYETNWNWTIQQIFPFLSVHSCLFHKLTLFRLTDRYQIRITPVCRSRLQHNRFGTNRFSPIHISSFISFETATFAINFHIYCKASIFSIAKCS